MVVKCPLSCQMSPFGACLWDLLCGVYPFAPLEDVGNRHPYTFLTNPLGSCLPAVPLSEHSQKPPSGESFPDDSGSATFLQCPPTKSWKHLCTLALQISARVVWSYYSLVSKSHQKSSRHSLQQTSPG